MAASISLPASNDVSHNAIEELSPIELHSVEEKSPEDMDLDGDNDSDWGFPPDRPNTSDTDSNISFDVEDFLSDDDDFKKDVEKIDDSASKPRRNIKVSVEFPWYPFPNEEVCVIPCLFCLSIITGIDLICLVFYGMCNAWSASFHHDPQCLSQDTLPFKHT